MSDESERAERARLHKPTDSAALRVAAMQLARQGLKVRDIATALELSEAAVRQLLEPPELHQPTPEGPKP